MWPADRTCERREGVDESGEQPEGQPNRLAMMTGSKRPRALPKRQREKRKHSALGNPHAHNHDTNNYSSSSSSSSDNNGSGSRGSAAQVTR